MNARMRIASPIWQALRGYHLRPSKKVEALSYIWARVEESRQGLTVLVPHTAPSFLLAADCFERQAGGNVRLHADVQRGLLIKFARSHFNALINVHDHWFDGRTVFSAVDDADDCAFDRYLRERYEPMLRRLDGVVARPIWNIAMVLGQVGADARVVDTRWKDGPFRPIHSIAITNSRYQSVPLRHERPALTSTPMLARQRDFVPLPEQATLLRLHAVIAGCGGIGSALAEALGRIGIRHLTLLDHDRLDETNLNRWQGGKPRMVGRPKVKLLAARLRQLFPDIHVDAVCRSIFDRAAERHLVQADVIFGALDADAPRYFLNRVALQHLLPYFDIGVAVARDGEDVDFRTRAFTILPGHTACLDCTQYHLFDRRSAQAELLDAATRAAWQRAGYIVDEPGITAPSVYALNQRAVGLAVTEFLNWVCGWRPTATHISESWSHGTFQRADRKNFPEQPDPECALCAYTAGAGSSEPLPRPAAFRRNAAAVRNLKTSPLSKEHDDGTSETRAH